MNYIHAYKQYIDYLIKLPENDILIEKIIKIGESNNLTYEMFNNNMKKLSSEIQNEINSYLTDMKNMFIKNKNLYNLNESIIERV